MPWHAVKIRKALRMLALQPDLMQMVQSQKENPRKISFQSLIGLNTEQV